MQSSVCLLLRDVGATDCMDHYPRGHPAGANYTRKDWSSLVLAAASVLLGELICPALQARRPQHAFEEI